MEIYNGSIHGAKTLKEIFNAGYTKCDECGGKRFSGNCLFHLGSDMLDGEKDPLGAVRGGFCKTKKENYNRDVTRYGMGRC